MKTIIVLSLILSVSSAWAENCAQLQNRFLSYNIVNEQKQQSKERSDRFEGQVWPLIEKFNSHPNVNDFRCIVGLSAASANWDFDAAAAGAIGSKLKDPAMKDAYEQALSVGQFPDQCRANDFRNTVNLKICTGGSDGQTATNKQIRDCEHQYAPKMTLEDCERASLGKTEKKSPSEIASKQCPPGIHNLGMNKVFIPQSSSPNDVAQTRSAKQRAASLNNDSQKASTTGRGPASTSTENYTDDSNTAAE